MCTDRLMAVTRGNGPAVTFTPLDPSLYISKRKNIQTANNKYKKGTAQPRPGAEPRDSQPGAGQTPGRPSHGAAPAYKAHQDAPGSVVGAPQVAPPSRPDGATMSPRWRHPTVRPGRCQRQPTTTNIKKRSTLPNSSHLPWNATNYYGFQTVCKCPFWALLVTLVTDSNQTWAN